MITYGEVEKLRSTRAADQSVLSLYVYVPSDSASLRQLSSRAAGLIEAAAASTPDTLHRADELLASRTLAQLARQWPGHTLGIFVSEQLSLVDVVPLPGRFAERAVLAARPHLRPLLAALERHPDHRIVVIDHRHAWLIAVAGERVEVVARVPADAAPSAGFGGWYLEPSHGLQRVTELAPHLYEDAARILDCQARHGRPQPLVAGGYADSITHLLALLPQAVLTEYAGSFAADPKTLTLNRARDLAAPILSHWEERRERQVVDAVMAPRPGIPTAIGVEECLGAVNAGTADLLLIADEPIVPGFHCERCDALSVSSDGCCDWGAASWPVPDLLEEMAWRMLHGGGQVLSASRLPCTAAARVQLPAGQAGLSGSSRRPRHDREVSVS
jgi:Bacterial archaeo-eukaryotic release factor family 10